MSSKYQWEAIEKKKTKGYIVSVSKQDSSVVIKNIYWGDDFYEETTAKKTTTTEKKSKKQFTKKTIDGIKYIGVLEVPELSLQLPVMSHWSLAGLKIAPGRYKGSVYKRNIIIAGHNYRSHFSRLKTLDIGSKIWFIDVEGNRFEYKVSDIEIIKGNDVKQMEKGKWDMTLFTCTYGGQNRMALRCTLTNAVAGEN